MKCYSISEQIRGIINTARIPIYNQTGVPINALIQNLQKLIPVLEQYNPNYANYIKNNIPILKNNDDSLNPYQFGGIVCILGILERELNSQSVLAKNSIHTYNDIKVFIGHGHNLLWSRIALFLSDILKIKPCYFEDENRCGKIIPSEIERFVNDPSIKLAIFTLMKEVQTKDGWLPRQNVIDEAARFSTRLGRENVLLIVENGVIIPSNLQGIVYIEYTNDEEAIVLKIKDFIQSKF